MRPAYLVLICALLAAACASPPPPSAPAELDRYRANSGEPVRSFTYNGRLWGWRSLGDQALALWARRDQGYLLEFDERCPDLAFAASITVTNRSGLVISGIDSVRARRSSGGVGGSRCRIASIRPIDHQVIQASRRDVRDADWTTRETSDPAGER